MTVSATLRSEAASVAVEVRCAQSTPETAVPRILVIVPTYNEAENVSCLAYRILEAVPHAEVLFIDDNSPDGTAAVIEKLGRENAAIRILSRPRKLGLGTAYAAGFELACAERFDVAVTMDADLSHDPSHLPALIDEVAEHDLVIGSRYIPGGGVRNWGLHRRVLSRTANLYSKWLLRLPIADSTSGFRAYRVELLRNLPVATIKSSGYSFLEEMNHLACRHGGRVSEVPILFVDRRGGKSKISSKEIFLAVYHVLRLRIRGSHPAS